MKFLAILALAGLVGCASPGTVPENVEGVFCTSVQTLTTTVTTVFANKEIGKVTTTPDCSITINTK